MKMGLKKQYLKARPVCKVTFRLPVEAAGEAAEVAVVGDFNDWRAQAHPMKKLKNGSFKTVIDLETGKEYQFRYLIDGSSWENDWDADAYVLTDFGDCENSVVRV